ncbi:cation transport ATPase [Metarhizium album ARSEF 1941]|uniref:Cation transport ATPase n=1 Tax=Metarhizium album (strain ARSEF 1941) TaxID=1081103 RepID=A0A0B2X574_METAS|nr:cation transport ATPase [Metarhizium album ARSEF 1941]KHO00451.1 cation transport ATPase [Metarhizium album ARSEF 1941]
MGTECCSGGGCHDATPAAGPEHNHDNHHHGEQSHQHDSHDHQQVQDHAHNHDNGDDSDVCAVEEPCTQEGECCDDESCCGDSSLSETLACCSSNDEHCDEKCILAAAALECEKTCETDNLTQSTAAGHEHQHDANGHHPSGACNSHLEKAFNQYSAYLDSARCICRSILERGWSTTCCANQPRKVPSDGVENICVDKPGIYASGRKVHKHDGPHHHHEIRRRGKMSKHEKNEGDPCCQPVKSDCCGDHALSHDAIQPADNANSHGCRAVERDVEKAEGLEHVALLVDGMTCSGCGNKMANTLNRITGVSSVKVNFVMGHAEFELDTSVTTVTEVVRAAERATNFRCNRMATDDQVLDVLALGKSAKALLDCNINGVTGATILNKRTVRLSYVPTVIGARELLEKLQGQIEGLAPPRDDPSVSSGRKRLYDQLAKTTLAAVFTIPVLVLAWGDSLVGERKRAIVSIILATLVQMIAIPDFYRPAIGALIHSGTIEMDMLVVISITAAYSYSVVAFGFRMAGAPLETSEFFETSTLLITLVILGRLVAAFARIRAVEAVSVRSLQTTMAVIVENNSDREIDARLLQYGDKLKIGPDSGVPTDGIVLSGLSDVDESMLTGESVPVSKKQGDAVIAGTVNKNGVLIAQLTRLPGKNTVTDIAQLVEEAQNSKPKIQDYADRVASWFVPVVTSVAIIVVIVWLVVGLKVRNYNTGKSISNAITYAVATLAVSCPCALGLAVPMVLVIAGGIAARNGVIIKSAESTERARKVTDVVFDKTGTITEENLDVKEQVLLINDAAAISISKALVAGNKHPVSLAVAKHLEGQSIPAETLTDVQVIPGAGVEAKLDGASLRAGNPKWTKTASHDAVSRLQDQGMTLLVITQNEAPIALFGLGTHIRAEASRVVSQLTSRNIAIHLVSGDQKQAVEMVGSAVGIPKVVSQCTPVEKRDYVAGLMQEGKCVIFVGDGTNDAVAVSQADVGVQLGSVLSASDVTGKAADVVLLNGLEGIPFLLEISRVSFRRMVFNFAWSAVYNVLAILLASGALVKVRIPPAYAGLGEIVSVVPVIVAAMTMLLNKSKASAQRE